MFQESEKLHILFCMTVHLYFGGRKHMIGISGEDYQGGQGQ
jgi:hypothetical protein